MTSRLKRQPDTSPTMQNLSAFTTTPSPKKPIAPSILCSTMSQEVANQGKLEHGTLGLVVTLGSVSVPLHSALF